MNSEIQGSKLGAAFDFPLQWGSCKRLRCPKLANGVSIGGKDGSSLLQKSIRARERAVRADKQIPSRRRIAQGDSVASYTSDLVEVSNRLCEASYNPVDEPVESSVVDKEDTNRNNCSSRAAEILLAGDCSQSFISIQRVRERNEENADLFILPKFLISLSRKEKEDDFLAIKGSRLPPRPKKRAKHIQRILHSISPGSWLCKLTLDRYEVSEKGSVKKRPHGLKALSSLESDSD